MLVFGIVSVAQAVAADTAADADADADAVASLGMPAEGAVALPIVTIHNKKEI